MLKFFLIGLIVLRFAGNSFSQIDPPKIVKPSPTASELFKFQDYPVDYSTGLSQISIPIYEVTSGSLSVPISLSYHAAGRKVYDQDGPIALGWNLNAGGMISRVIHGVPDFGTHTFPNPFITTGITNYDNLNYLQRIMRYQNGWCEPLFPFYDSEYDVFSYSVGGNSGKFIFKDVANVKTPVLLPYKPFVVTPITSAPPVITFDITDDKGVTYKFEAYESTQLDEYATTGWVLEKIISADKTDTISFTYTGGVETRKTISQLITYKDNWVEAGSPPEPNPSFIENTSQANYQVSRISEIIFKQGKVKFNLVSGSLTIDNIQVLNLNNEVIKTIQFKRSACYFQAEINNATNKLDTIEFKDKLNNVIENYAFEYYPVINSDINGPINVRYCDWWGYYNNSGQHDMLPQYTVPSIGFQSVAQIGNPSANRQPSLEPAKSGVLKKITYPTGGTTEFIYQLNKCKINGGNGSVVNGPGLRIHQIKSADANGTLQTRTFKYGANESDYGFLELLPDVSTVTNENTIVYFQGDGFDPTLPYPVGSSQYHRERYFSSGIYEELSELAERPVMYQEVTEYKGTEASNTGKTVYKYDYSPWAAAGLFPKKHIYNYNYWNNPSLISQMEYKRNNSIYKKIKSTGSSYTTTISENIKGLHVQRKYTLPQDGYHWGNFPGDDPLYYQLCSEEWAAYGTDSDKWPFTYHMDVYTFSDYQIQAGFKNLTTTSDTLFTDAGNIITGTSYTYNSKNLLSSTTTTTSKGETLLTNIKYPFDYTGNSTLDEMVSLNMIRFPVEQIETKTATPTKSVKTNYLNWGTSPARIAPQTVDVKVGSGNYETRLRYSAYDTDGNPLTVSKENDQLISYAWGYNNSYPIAEVTNSAVKNVFHTSFEDADGNSTLNDSKTGRLSRTGGYSKSLSNLDNGTYVLSYWQKSGSIWVLQYTAVAVTTGSYNISLAGQVDEVRFYPKGSQMKTYTYDPLIGTLTECDGSDHVIYYEYDNYGRLKLIKDMNGNVLKTFKYQYQGTTAN